MASRDTANTHFDVTGPVLTCCPRTSDGEDIRWARAPTRAICRAKVGGGWSMDGGGRESLAGSPERVGSRGSRRARKPATTPRTGPPGTGPRHLQEERSAVDEEALAGHE